MRIQYCHEILNLSWYFEIPIKLKFFIELMVKIKKIKKKKKKKKAFNCLCGTSTMCVLGFILLYQDCDFSFKYSVLDSWHLS
jgi:hypothetical protein